MLTRLRRFLFPSPDSATIRRKILARYGDMIDLPENTRLENFELEIRGRTPGKKRFVVGRGCVLSGRFVLESTDSQIRIGDDTFIGGGMFIALRNIDIGSDVMFSWGCTVIDNDAHSLHSEERKEDVKSWKYDLESGSIGSTKRWDKVACKPVRIGNRSWIGFNSILLKGVELGEGCIVGAGSVVTSRHESFTVLAGNPARLIRKTD